MINTIIMDESCVRIDREMWDSAFPVLSETNRGTRNTPIIIDNLFDFNYLFGGLDKYYNRNTKRVFSDLDPFGEENWED